MPGKRQKGGLAFFPLPPLRHDRVDFCSVTSRQHRAGNHPIEYAGRVPAFAGIGYLHIPILQCTLNTYISSLCCVHHENDDINTRRCAACMQMNQGLDSALPRSNIAGAELNHFNISTPLLTARQLDRRTAPEGEKCQQVLLDTFSLNGA